MTTNTITKRNRTSSPLLHLTQELHDQIYGYLHYTSFLTKEEGPLPRIQVCRQLRDEADLQSLTFSVVEEDGGILFNTVVMLPRQQGVTWVNWIKRLPTK
ncbi:hypothetical protein HBI82_169240 [Parastagonospora nodorum]|nr:hypothetical protein HBI00_180870 [Parastagonospora nodorum]KAH5714791.1 hypothetical protein HBI18_193700 [Parastagonospora nodorum]KAH5998383.1 hypothetical protein HBI82_169240 [Parastagonospora nodorum]